MNKDQAKRLINELHEMNKMLKNIGNEQTHDGDAVMKKVVYNPNLSINVKERTEEEATEIARELVRKMFEELKKDYEA